MAIRATNFTVVTMMLMAFNIAMMWVRQKRSVENNWPPLYWGLILVFTIVRPEETFSFYFILIGLACGLLLRFEFMNSFFTKTIRFVELLVFCYVIVQGINIITY